MSPARRKHSPHSLRVVQVAVLLAVLLGLITGGLVFYEAGELRDSQAAQVEFHARALDDQTASVLSSTELLLRALMPPVERSDGTALAAAERLSALFEDSLRGRPFLRSVSLLSLSGRVLASSNRQNLNALLNPEQLGTRQAPDRQARLGQLVAGRDLLNLGKQPAAEAVALALPMVVATEYLGERVLLVALINPDLFATQYERLLAGTHHQALILDLEGQIIAATSGLATGPGHRLAKFYAFEHFLPKRESGSQIGPGIDGGKALSAFRALRDWPLLVVVEQPYEVLLADVRHLAGWAGGFLFAAWLLLGFSTWAARRVLLRDEQLSQALHIAHIATKASESRKLAILQSSLDGIVTIDAQGRIIDFNPAAERMFGYSAAQVLRQPMHELLIPPRHRLAHVRGMAHFQATGEARVINRRIEVEAQRADGSTFAAELTIVPVHTEGALLFTATLRDVTERQRVERALRDSEARARATFEQAGVGVLQQGVDGSLLRANPTLCKLLGYGAAELLALSEAQLVHADDLRACAEGMRRLRAGEVGSLVQDRRLRQKTGQFIWTRMTASLARDEQRQPLYLIGIFEDISERRRAEDALAAARQRELRISSRIQTSLLVTAPPPDIDGLHLSSFSQASQGIDGDFVEVIRVGPHCVDIITGDVMGKGIAAAMMGAATKMQFSRSIAELMISAPGSATPPSPSAIVGAVHRAMTPALQALESFVTLCYLRIDTEHQTISWVGCGHEEPLRVPAFGRTETLANQHPPLGVLDTPVFEQSEMRFLRGDTLFLCSDGITDAIRPDGERVGRQRMIDALSRRKRLHGTPAALLHSLRAELLPAQVQVTDDVTMVVVQRGGPQPGAARAELPVQLQSIRQVRDFVTTHAEAAGLDEASASLLAVAMVEVFTNVVRHATGRPDGAPVELLAYVQNHVQNADQGPKSGSALVLELIHLGHEFTPPADPPETDFSAYPEGGFGLEIIQGSSDRVEYAHVEGVNTLRMTKQLPS